jgi:hypothetical protein
MFKKILLTALVLLIAGVIFAVYLFNIPQKKVERENSVVISASLLEQEFNSDEKTSNIKYLNKAIEVSGTIMEVDKNQDGGLMIVLKTDDTTKGVQCTMRDKNTGNYTKGQQIAIKGFCSDFGITGVSLTGCVVKG